jgi:hypothetical protein
MDFMTVKTVRAYLAGEKVIILLVGGIEQRLPLAAPHRRHHRRAPGLAAGERLGMLVALAVLTTFRAAACPGRSTSRRRSCRSS